LPDSKEKKQASNFTVLDDFKRKKNKIVFKFSIVIIINIIMKLNYLVFILIMKVQFAFFEMRTYFYLLSAEIYLRFF
jgi:hypothetical protein